MRQTRCSQGKYLLLTKWNGKQPTHLTTTFTVRCCREEMLALTPDDIYKWMCKGVYGVEDPSNDMVPTKQSTTLEYWKKSISHFMYTTAKWHETSQTGNATQSKKVNNLIKVVKRAEARGTGKNTSADRAFTVSEFKQILDLKPDRRYRAMMNFQYHLIARSDDTCHVKKDVLSTSSEFEGYLTAKIRWSKNVGDDTNCREQILIPSMDTRTFCYLNLALWLEYWIQYGEGTLSQWLFIDGTANSESC
jgi:hypothetical protein